MEASGRRYQRRPIRSRPVYRGRTPKVNSPINEGTINRLLIRLAICALIFVALTLYRNAGLDMSRISKAIDANEAMEYSEIMGYIGRVISPGGVIDKNSAESENQGVDPLGMSTPQQVSNNADTSGSGLSLPSEPADNTAGNFDMPDNAVLDPAGMEQGDGLDHPEEDAIIIETANGARTPASAETYRYQNLSFITDDLGADTTDPGPFKMLEPDNVVASKVNLGFKYTSPLVGNITSPFAYRVHPLDGQTKFHYGIDIGGGQGKSILAFAAGTVIEAGYNVAYGNYVKIEHSSGFLTLYGHCSKLYVSRGNKVKMGQKIATVGMTGWATGPHLHFEIRKSGRYYDPSYYI